MSRVVVPGLDLEAEIVELPDDASHHASRVLRLRPGDEVTLLDGRGGIATGTIEGPPRGRRLAVRIAERGRAEPRSLPRLALVLGLPKGDKPDEIVRRATELGVAAVHPAVAERSVARPDLARAASRVARWRRIAAEATRQCGRGDVPEVAEVLPLAEAMERARGEGPGVVLWEEERARGLAAALSGARGADGVALVVGPEGGLTAREVAAARGLGYEVATLGPLVLRVETAAVVACAVAQHLLGALDPG